MEYSSFSDEQIKALAASIDRQGYAVLPNWASPAELAEVQALVERSVAEAGNRYVALTGHQAVTGSLLYEWGRSPVFLDLCRRVVTQATGRAANDDGLHQVLRCLVGDSGHRESMIFHYDSFVLTTIMPVCMPEGEKGDLLMLPSKRPLRGTYAMNLIDKLKVDNRWSQRHLIKAYQQGSNRFTQVAMEPGNMYLFWGYRSLHTNLPADPGGIRATAVFHYDNLHGASSLAGRIRSSLAFVRPGRRAMV
ncbi:hypothetical protein [Pseudomonas sp. M47T1]|uniref:hypothetical protein n=2 Tax=unclassified Pseudomonas TaxID=196821 RepID=UPI0003067915|nr:hypothetical protein [Pseudomonas sp. M47T1]